MNPILKVQIPQFKIESKTLLSQVGFSLNSNELLVIIGRNGAGKSTLLKHITQEISNPMADIEVWGKAIKQFSVKEIAQRRAVLTQQTLLNFAYQVLEVVMLGRYPHQRHQYDSEQDFQIAKQCLAEVGLQGYEERNYLTLSGGEQQRVHLARVLAQLQQPEKDKLLLLDEPTNNLDIAHQHHTLALVKKRSHEDLSCVAVLHDLNLASQYADRILLLDQGKILALGRPHEVLTSEILSKAFGYQIHIIEHPIHKCPLII